MQITIWTGLIGEMIKIGLINVNMLNVKMALWSTGYIMMNVVKNKGD